MSRKKILPKTQDSVLKNCRRRCSLCFYFNFDTDIKDGQIAHIDRNNSNNKEENLTYLCLSHHDQYDCKPSQSKRITESELIEAKAKLEEFILDQHNHLTPLPMKDPKDKAKMKEVRKISIDLYHIRYPIYEAFKDFVMSIVQETEFNVSDFYRFRDRTHDALFLYGDEIDSFLDEVARKAIELRHKQNLIKNPERYNNEERQNLVKEETDVILWFSNILNEGKLLFSKYLRI